MTRTKYHVSDYEAKLNNYTHQSPKVMIPEKRTVSLWCRDDLQKEEGGCCQVNHFYFIRSEVGAFFKHIKTGY